MTAKHKHPGKTAAQRRALDEIGCGFGSPPMAAKTRDALLRAGLIEQCGVKVLLRPYVSIPQYQMPPHVHWQWCLAMEDEAEAV